VAIYRTRCSRVSEIAIIGREDLISIFKMYGVECYAARDSEGDIKEIFDKVYRKDYKIIFVTEDVYSKCKHLIEDDRVYPQVTILPDNRGSKGFGEQKTRKLIIKALGADIMQKE
jgi:vacuolar-type H+-ATPase subunit F/Vma7